MTDTPARPSEEVAAAPPSGMGEIEKLLDAFGLAVVVAMARNEATDIAEASRVRHGRAALLAAIWGLRAHALEEAAKVADKAWDESRADWTGAYQEGWRDAADIIEQRIRALSRSGPERPA